MKGIVFTEFLDTVDEAFGEDVTDTVVARCPLASGGAYTAVGQYDAGELHALVGVLSEETNVSPADLQKVYGRRLFGRFFTLYPALFEGASCPLGFLARVEDEIHVEVRKLYPDAELPELIPQLREPGRLVLRYRSERRLESFCHGLIEGCLDHFDTAAVIEMTEGHDDRGIYFDFDIAVTGTPAA